MTLRVATVGVSKDLRGFCEVAAQSLGEQVEFTEPEQADAIIVGPNQAHPQQLATRLGRQQKPTILFVYEPKQEGPFQSELLTAPTLPSTVASVAHGEGVRQAVESCLRRASHRRRHIETQSHRPVHEVRPGRLPKYQWPEAHPQPPTTDAGETSWALARAEEAAGLATWSLDIKSGTWHWSPRLPTLLGLADNEPFTVQCLIEQAHIMDRPRLRRAIERLGLGQAMDVQFRLAAKQGPPRPVRVVVDVDSDTQGPVRLRGSVQDLSHQGNPATQRMEAAALRVAEAHELQAVKNRFMNTLAHELNTPLTPIQLQIYLGRRLAEDLDEPRITRVLDVVERNVKRMERLVEDLLSSVRIQSGTLALKQTRLDFKDIIIDTLEAQTERAEAAGLQLDLRVGGGQYVLEGDEARLRETAAILISNAIKFSTNGGIIRIRLQRDPGRIHLEVRDPGIGISARGLGELFEPFARVHEPKLTDPDGTGLGLYIARGIVEAHGGTIEATSQGPGKGTTFQVHLPVSQ